MDSANIIIGKWYLVVWGRGEARARLIHKSATTAKMDLLFADRYELTNAVLPITNIIREIGPPESEENPCSRSLAEAAR